MPVSDILVSAPAERNRDAILEVLRRVLPERGYALEIASGTGQHAEHFARALPGWTWQPSDPDPRHRASISARIEQSGLPNLLPPLDLDVLEAWAVPVLDAVIVANLLHISAKETLPALFEGAAGVLRTGGIVHVYGPFKRYGAHTAPSNAAFDDSLRQRNPAWGLRDLERVLEVAERNGFANLEITEMPANNFSLSFERR